MNKKILLIEDDESSRETLESFLDESGYEVISTGDGLVGLDLMKKQNPDLVITDNRLPHINGIELACINAGSKKRVPFIIVSAFDNLSDYIEGLGEIVFIQKPIDIKYLKQCVENAFA